MAHVASGLRWALGILVVLQAAFPEVLQPLLPVWIAGPVVRGEPFAARSPLQLFIGGAPWLVYAAMHVVHARLLRRAGSFPFGDAEVVGMALVPLYNLYGSYRLFDEAAAGAERAGAGRRVASQIRAGAILSLALAVAQMVLYLWFLGRQPAFGPWPADPLAAALGTMATLLLLAARLFLLWRLHPAMTAVAAAPAARPAEQAPPSEAVPDAGVGSCPDCGEAHPLQRSPSELAELVCGSCGGALLDADSVIGLEILLATEGGPGGGAGHPEPIPGARTAPCAACGAAASRVRLATAGAWSCTSCGSLWMPAAGLHRITGGRCGVLPRAASLATAWPGASRLTLKRARALGAAVAALGVVALAAALWEAKLAYCGRLSQAEASLVPFQGGLVEQRARELLAEALQNSGRRAAAALATPSRPGPAAAPEARSQPGPAAAPAAEVPLPAPARPPPPETRLAAGRTVDWWRDRLRLLSGRSDGEGQQLYSLTRERAEANGLEVKAGASGPEVRFPEPPQKEARP
jgi:hypothetical protein